MELYRAQNGTVMELRAEARRLVLEPVGERLPYKLWFYSGFASQHEALTKAREEIRLLGMKRVD